MNFLYLCTVDKRYLTGWSTTEEDLDALAAALDELK